MGCPVANSDVDVVALFAGRATDDEREQFRAMIATLRAGLPFQLDVTIVNEDDLLRDGATRFKFATRLLYGEDVRPSLPLRPLDAYACSEMMSGATALFRTRNNPSVLHLSLAPPDPDNEFLGYAARIMSMPDRTGRASTRDVVNAVVLLGTAILAAEARQYVHHKSELATLYRTHIGDEWIDHIEGVYRLCRNSWAYLVPENATDRQRLRTLCEHELAFEKAFVPRFQAFWQSEAAIEDETTRVLAARQLARFI